MWHLRRQQINNTKAIHTCVGVNSKCFLTEVCSVVSNIIFILIFPIFAVGKRQVLQRAYPMYACNYDFNDASCSRKWIRWSGEFVSSFFCFVPCCQLGFPDNCALNQTHRYGGWTKKKTISNSQCCGTHGPLQSRIWILSMINAGSNLKEANYERKYINLQKLIISKMLHSWPTSLKLFDVTLLKVGIFFVFILSSPSKDLTKNRSIKTYLSVLFF